MEKYSNLLFLLQSLKNWLKKNQSKSVARIAQTKGTRDIFGRLLFLSFKENFDIKTIFKYPLLPEPVCFAHPDGSIRKSPKNKLLHFLKKDINSFPPDSVSTAIVGGMYMLRCLIATSTTYQALAGQILKECLKLTNHRIDICFDLYESPSLKDVKRKIRGDEGSHRIFSIGPKQKIE